MKKRVIALFVVFAAIDVYVGRVVQRTASAPRTTISAAHMRTT